MSLLAALSMAGLSGSIAGCNAVEGAGKDVQAVGAATTDEAREQKS